MESWKDKRYWLIGASEGLGRALAKTMSNHGIELILSSRSEKRLKELCDELPSKASYCCMDVSNLKDVKRAAKSIGEVDGIIFLVGAYWPLRSQDWDVEKIETMCDTNFTGAARVIGQVLPIMIKKNRGHIVLTGSLVGYRGLAGSIGYGASKAGIMYLAETLYADLFNTNIKVQLINPGFIDTRLTKQNKFNMPFIMSPEKAANIFFNFMKKSGFKKDFPFLFSMIFRLGRFLPGWIYYRLQK